MNMENDEGVECFLLHKYEDNVYVWKDSLVLWSCSILTRLRRQQVEMLIKVSAPKEEKNI